MKVKSKERVNKTSKKNLDDALWLISKRRNVREKVLLTKNLESTLAGKKAKPRMYLVAMNTSYELSNQRESQMERGGVVQGKWEKRVNYLKSSGVP